MYQASKPTSSSPPTRRIIRAPNNSVRLRMPDKLSERVSWLRNSYMTESRDAFRTKLEHYKNVSLSNCATEDLVDTLVQILTRVDGKKQFHSAKQSCLEMLLNSGDWELVDIIIDIHSAFEASTRPLDVLSNQGQTFHPKIQLLKVAISHDIGIITLRNYLEHYKLKNKLSADLMQTIITRFSAIVKKNGKTKSIRVPPLSIIILLVSMGMPIEENALDKWLSALRTHDDNGLPTSHLSIELTARDGISENLHHNFRIVMGYLIAKMDLHRSRLSKLYNSVIADCLDEEYRHFFINRRIEPSLEIQGLTLMECSSHLKGYALLGKAAFINASKKISIRLEKIEKSKIDKIIQDANLVNTIIATAAYHLEKLSLASIDLMEYIIENDWDFCTDEHVIHSNYLNLLRNLSNHEQLDSVNNSTNDITCRLNGFIKFLTLKWIDSMWKLAKKHCKFTGISDFDPYFKDFTCLIFESKDKYLQGEIFELAYTVFHEKLKNVARTRSLASLALEIFLSSSIKVAETYHILRKMVRIVIRISSAEKILKMILKRCRIEIANQTITLDTNILLGILIEIRPDNPDSEIFGLQKKTWFVNRITDIFNAWLLRLPADMLNNCQDWQTGSGLPGQPFELLSITRSNFLIFMLNGLNGVLAQPVFTSEILSENLIHGILSFALNTLSLLQSSDPRVQANEAVSNALKHFFDEPNSFFNQFIQEIFLQLPDKKANILPVKGHIKKCNIFEFIIENCNDPAQPIKLTGLSKALQLDLRFRAIYQNVAEAITRKRLVQDMTLNIPMHQDDQSVHSSGTHKSVTQSVNRLIKKYDFINFSQTSAFGDLQQDLENYIHTKAVSVIREALNVALHPVSSEHLDYLLPYLLSSSLYLNENQVNCRYRSDPHFLAYSWYKACPLYEEFVDPSGLTVFHVLLLVWYSISDLAAASSEADKEAYLAQLRSNLIGTLGHIQTNYNTDNPPNPYHKPSCASGAFNLIVDSLSGIHPEVEISRISSVSIKFYVKDNYEMLLKLYETFDREALILRSYQELLEFEDQNQASFEECLEATNTRQRAEELVLSEYDQNELSQFFVNKYQAEIDAENISLKQVQDWTLLAWPLQKFEPLELQLSQPPDPVDLEKLQVDFETQVKNKLGSEHLKRTIEDCESAPNPSPSAVLFSDSKKPKTGNSTGLPSDLSSAGDSPSTSSSHKRTPPRL